MSPRPEQMPAAPVSRKRATLLLVLGGYLNTGIIIVQGLLLIPLYLHFIGAELYGLWMASGGILAMLGVVNFGISSMLVQRVASAYGQQDFAKAGAYFVNAMLVYVAIVVVFMAIGMLCSLALPELLKVSGDKGEQLRQCFQLAVFSAALGMLNECLRAFPQALLRPVFSMLALAAARIVGVLATGILLYREAGLWAIPVGIFVTEVLVFFLGLAQAVVLLRSLHTKAKVDLVIVKEFTHVGGFLFVARLGHAISKESDPLLITLLLRPELAAAYVVTRKAADIISQMLAVIYGASHSAFSHLSGQGNLTRTNSVATRLLAMVFVLGLLGFVPYVGANHYFVSLWVGDAFSAGRDVIFFIGLGFLASNFRNMLLQTLNGLGDFVYTSKLTFFEGLGRVGVGAVFLYFFGIIGVPLSLTVASCITIVFLGMKLKSVSTLEFPGSELAKALTVTIGLLSSAVMISFLVEATQSWLFFVLIALALTVSTLIVCVLSYRHIFQSLLKGLR